MQNLRNKKHHNMEATCTRSYLVAKILFLVTWKARQTITSLLDWSNVGREVSPHRLDDLSILNGGSFSRDGWPFGEQGSLLLPLVLGGCWSFADNQRKMWFRRTADTKSAAITFTFTLHYWIFIHWALSQWVMSGRIDGANAFCLRDDGSSRIDMICRAFTPHEGESARQKNTMSNKKKEYYSISLYLTFNNGSVFPDFHAVREMLSRAKQKYRLSLTASAYSWITLAGELRLGLHFSVSVHNQCSSSLSPSYLMSRVQVSDLWQEN